MYGKSLSSDKSVSLSHNLKNGTFMPFSANLALCRYLLVQILATSILIEGNPRVSPT